MILTSNRVMVRPIVEDLKSPGGLYLIKPDTTFTHGHWDKETAQTKGEVLAIGPKVSEVQIGDVVRFSDSCGHLFELDGAVRRFIRDDDVAAIL